MTLFVTLLSIVLLLFAFYGGICMGIKDCKNQFGIPKKAIGVDYDGEYIFK